MNDGRWWCSREDEIFFSPFSSSNSASPPRLRFVFLFYECCEKRKDGKQRQKLKDCHCRSLLSPAGIRLWRGLRWVSVSECWQVGCWRAYRTEWVHSAERRTVEWRNPEVARPQPVPRRTQRTDQTLRYAARARERTASTPHGGSQTTTAHTHSHSQSFEVSGRKRKREKKHSNSFCALICIAFYSMSTLLWHLVRLQNRCQIERLAF